jgi:UDP-N-acetylmuramyl pentapeptide phosphotransferase/UDP-N-acetylglucosamine-1-phosphate transferase
MNIWLLVIFITCAGISLLLCGIAKLLFPKFRSGEHKPGTHRPDLPAGGREIKTFELPLVGGPAMTIAIICTGIGAGYFLNFNQEQWTLLLISLAAAFSYALVGFLDDWRKVYNNEGLSDIAKFGGVFFVSIAAAAAYFFLLPYSGQEPYTFWKDLPILSNLLHPLACTIHDGARVCMVSLNKGPVAYFIWLIFILLMTGVFASLTSLSVDFSDGLDGLAGGLVFSAALAFGVVVAGLLNKPSGIVLEILSLLTAAATLGFLPWNWPSAWAARKGVAPRRARIYMGDSGALGLGGLIAMVAIFSRNETLLLIVGGAFVLEGLSALTQSRVLTPLYRRHLQTMRFASSKEFVPHTEFPLPFLATPLHHHFDLLGWDRRRLVYSAWVLGACFAFLGASISLAIFPWQRYVVRVLALILAVAVWTSGSWTKCYFVGKYPAERSRRRRLALYYGFPYRLMGIPLCHLVETIEASEDVIETPAEELALWQRMTIFDARSMLGLYCYRAGYYPAALAQWTRIPERNRVLRPEIMHLLAEVDSRLAVEQQETQPMRRDAILQQQAMYNDKLPLADLPNPYEPVSRPATGKESADDWDSEEDEEEMADEADKEARISTTALPQDVTNPASSGHNPTLQFEAGQSSIVLGSLQTAGTTLPENQSWFARLLHFPQSK